MQLTRTINNELKKWQKKCRSLPRLLATTILAISMDKNGKFIGVNIWEMDAYYGTLTVPTACRPFFTPKWKYPKFNLSDHELHSFLLSAFLSLDKTWCQKDHSFIRWNEQPERSSHFRYLFCAESRSPESENDKHQKFL